MNTVSEVLFCSMWSLVSCVWGHVVPKCCHAFIEISSKMLKNAVFVWLMPCVCIVNGPKIHLVKSVLLYVNCPKMFSIVSGHC